jgi:hypothetical protein
MMPDAWCRLKHIFPGSGFSELSEKKGKIHLTVAVPALDE